MNESTKIEGEVWVGVPRMVPVMVGLKYELTAVIGEDDVVTEFERAWGRLMCDLTARQKGEVK